MTVSKDEVTQGMNKEITDSGWWFTKKKKVGVLKKGKRNYTDSINLIWKGVYTTRYFKIPSGSGKALWFPVSLYHEVDSFRPIQPHQTGSPTEKYH